MSLSYLPSEKFFSREFGNEFYSNRSRPILIGINLRSPANIGGLIRIAGNIGCEKVIFTGNKEILHEAKVKRAASNAYNKIEIIIVNDENWKNSIPKDYYIVAIETAEGATNIYKTKLPSKIAFVVGDESHGIPEEFLADCNSAIYIPMLGHTLSLNVMQSAAISMFEWYRQQSVD